MNLNKYGYIRVSTKKQCTDRQKFRMNNLNIPICNIFEDKQSGKNFDRKQYKMLLETLKPGDVLYVISIDRLGRNYNEIIVQWNLITQKMKVDIVVVDFPLLDTRIRHNELTGVLISNLVLQIMSYIAHIERENILLRQKEGIKSAKAKGIRFGHPEKRIPDNFEKVYSEWLNKSISGREAARLLNVDKNTFKKWVINKENI